jgi:hypothetical protein
MRFGAFLSKRLPKLKKRSRRYLNPYSHKLLLSTSMPKAGGPHALFSFRKNQTDWTSIENWGAGS